MRNLSWARSAGPLQRALYIEPSFSLAAFKLARSRDALGEADAARRAYERTLWTLDQPDDQAPARLERVDTLDISAACRARLRALSPAQRGSPDGAGK